MTGAVGTWRWQGLEVHLARTQHVIADISYTATPNWLLCTDGVRLEDATPEGLEVQWRAHGGKALAVKNDIEERHGQPGLSEVAMYRALAYMLDGFAETCTCATTAVEDCDNYVPGDEAEGAFND